VALGAPPRPVPRARPRRSHRDACCDLFLRNGLAPTSPEAIVAVQDGGDGTVAIVDGKAAKLVPGPPVCP